MTTRPNGARTRPIVVLLATLAGVAIAARLGLWQLDRAAQKLALQQQREARATLPEVASAALATGADEALAQHDRRVRLHGRWLERFTVFLDNRPMAGRAGFYVLTPLQLADGDRAVLVQRGWLPRDIADPTRMPPLRADPGEVVVRGRIAPPPGRLYDFGGAASGAIRQNLDLAAYARETGLPLPPLVVVQDQPSGGDDGLLRQWPPPAADVHKHQGYAFQWFALGALMAVLYVWFQLVRPFVRRSA